MTINVTDVKILKSQRLTDEDDGGGRATSESVVDGEVNNLFSDISRMDRTVGDVSLRKVYAGPVTDTDDSYLGAHSIVAGAPADPRVSVLLFNTESQTDERSDARDAIESYVAAASSAPFELLGTQLAGQRAIACVQREEQRVPEIGEVFQLTSVNGSQYVRLTDVQTSLEQFTYEITSGNFQTFTRRRLDLSISAALLYLMPGGQVTPAGTAATALNGQAKTQVLTTQVADAARYYGISPLAEAISEGALTVRVESVYAQLVPSTTKESALVDLLAGYQRVIYLPAGPTRSGLSLTVAASAVTGTSRTYLGTGCAPGTLSLTVNSGVFADDSTGGLRFVSGSNWISAGTIDYQTGEITLTRTGTTWTGTATASYQPGAAATGETLTGEIGVTLGTRGYVYTLSLPDAIPRAGTLSISYMALGRWYELRDYGDGLLTGEGAGTINFSTGSVSITLNALPDVDTSLVYNYISSADGAITQRTGSSVTPKLEVRYTLPDAGIVPSSYTATFLAGTVTKTLTDDGKGNLSGTGGTGTIYYATGEVTMVLSTTPSGGITHAYKNGAVSGTALALSSDSSGIATFTIPGAPLKAGSVRVDWMTTRRDAAPALNWDVINAGNALPVYDEYVDVSNSANDNGAGGWASGRAGSINYTTGECTLQVAALYTYTEYVYSTERSLSGGRTVTVPALVTTDTQIRETFGGTATATAQAAGVTEEDKNVAQAQPPLTVELLPSIAEPILPGSLLFSWNGSTYVDRSGVLYSNIATGTNGGTAVGTVNYVDRTATLTSYSGNVTGAVTILACLTTAVGFSVTSATFRTSGAPLRSASTQITAVRADTAEVVSAVADANGNFDSGIIQGTVDITTGIVRLRFTTDADDETTASDIPVIPLLTRYNAVVQTQLPLAADLLGLDPVRLPADGRVPIYRDGDVVVIHNTVETNVESPDAGGTIQLPRQQQAAIEVVDVNGTALSADSYSVDRELGTVTWANPLVLQDDEANPLTLPLVIRDRVEHMAMCTEVQITGSLAISSPVPWDLTAGDTFVSSAVVWGDMQARVHTWFTQQTWSTGAPNWTDEPSGNTTTAQYNSLSYPPVITNAGAIDGKWAIIFTSATAFQV
ncbi:hypothetical protein, partial [Pseudomonas sp. LRF_L74]|uniref:hypothetical protein n=1 Tax=Pseudomonas sp. LRF_L74 TaxID=3369422 RepID=UPI003F5DB028